MGASMVYLEKPNTEIEFQDGASTELKLRYSAGEMQGWRLNMVGTLILKNLSGRRAHFKFGVRPKVKSICSV
jgi:hypothetical protein